VQRLQVLNALARLIVDLLLFFLQHFHLSFETLHSSYHRIEGGKCLVGGLFVGE
jgi:hypothetical protein